MKTNFICIENLNRNYDDAGTQHMVLQDVSINIAQGELDAQSGAYLGQGYLEMVRN
jgi:ABC-type glutathione transport system ATPase component